MIQLHQVKSFSENLNEGNLTGIFTQADAFSERGYYS
jgi:predicted PhzF superfamily epimerase YddE/YHI9